MADADAGKMAWLLGFWVGDGNYSQSVFSVDPEDTELVARVDEYGKAFGLETTTAQYRRFQEDRLPLGELDANAAADAALQDPAAKQIDKDAVHCLSIQLRGPGFHGQCGKRNLNTNNVFWSMVLETGVRGPSDGDRKIVPEWLMIEALDVREHFIAGLIDSDGWVNKDDPSATVKTIYPQVRDGLVQLARSLGLRVTITTEGAKQVKGVSHKISYAVYMSGDDVIKSILSKCALERKRTPAPAIVSRRPQAVRFDVIEKVTGDYYGITLADDTDHMFLLANMMLVHNCGERGNEMAEVLMDFPEVSGISHSLSWQLPNSMHTSH